MKTKTMEEVGAELDKKEVPTEERVDANLLIEPDFRKKFFNKRIKYDADNGGEALVAKAIEMAILYEEEKFNIKKEGEEVKIAAVHMARIIADGDDNFYIRGIFKRRTNRLCAIMLGAVYNEIAISELLYVEPKHREKGLELELINAFKYWAEKVKKVDRVMVEMLGGVESNYNCPMTPVSTLMEV